MSHEQEADRGRLAKEVLDNPVYAEAYERIEKELIGKWRESRDKDEREHLHRLLRSLSKVRSIMEGVMNSGKVAEKLLEQEQTRLQRTIGKARNALWQG